MAKSCEEKLRVALEKIKVLTRRAEQAESDTSDFAEPLYEEIARLKEKLKEEPLHAEIKDLRKQIKKVTTDNRQLHCALKKSNAAVARLRSANDELICCIDKLVDGIEDLEHFNEVLCEITV